jgi:hypothetical protein
MRVGTLAVCLACLVTGCDGTLNLGTNDGGASANSEAGDAQDSSHSNDSPTSTTDSGKSSGGTILAALTAGGEDDAGSCVESCSVAPGPTTAFTAGPQIHGSWRICSGETGEFPPGTIGLEFDPGGHLYYLVAGPSGDPVRGSGFQYQATYETQCGGFIPVTGTNNFIFEPIVSACPRQVFMKFTSGDVACGGSFGPDS